MGIMGISLKIWGSLSVCVLFASSLHDSNTPRILSDFPGAFRRQNHTVAPWHSWGSNLKRNASRRFPDDFQMISRCIQAAGTEWVVRTLTSVESIRAITEPSCNNWEMQDLPMSHVAYRCHSVAGPQPFSPCAVRHTKDLGI